jgi:preprotein translocase subunit Sec61beta
VWGIVYLLFQLGDVFLGKKRAFLLVLLCMLDPMLAGQAILISPDLILVFGFFAGLVEYSEKKDLGKNIGSPTVSSLEYARHDGGGDFVFGGSL